MNQKTSETLFKALLSFVFLCSFFAVLFAITIWTPVGISYAAAKPAVTASVGVTLLFLSVAAPYVLFQMPSFVLSVQGLKAGGGLVNAYENIGLVTFSCMLLCVFAIPIGLVAANPHASTQAQATVIEASCSGNRTAKPALVQPFRGRPTCRVEG